LVPASVAEYAPGRIRTCGLSLRRRALYPLSYGRRRRSLRLSDRPTFHEHMFVLRVAYSRIMSTVAQGISTEAAVLEALVKKGLQVVRGSRFLRVQGKTAWRSGGCLIFNAYSTDHGRGQQSYVGRADVFGVYSPADDSVYLVPIGDVKSDGRLRIEPTRNNQRRRIRFAGDYAIDGWSIERLVAI
jgi:hypothetical protein